MQSALQLHTCAHCYELFFHRDLKDTQSTFTGALMALQPTLLLPPFLLPPQHPPPLSSAGLSLLYHGVINHATGSGSASTFQL